MNQLFFDNKASYDDWDIYLTSLVIGDAEPKEYYIDIPNGDGALDLSEALTGEIHYSNRSLEAEFTIKPPESSWIPLLQHIRAYLNGKQRLIRATNEPGYYLIGRLKTSFNRDGTLGKLTVTATCKPWKYKEKPTIRRFILNAEGQASGNCLNSRKRVIPTITASAEVTLLFNGSSTTVSAGTHRFTNIMFVEDDNQVTITGPAGATVEFEYQEGAL